MNCHYSGTPFPNKEGLARSPVTTGRSLLYSSQLDPPRPGEGRIVPVPPEAQPVRTLSLRNARVTLRASDLETDRLPHMFEKDQPAEGEGGRRDR